MNRPHVTLGHAPSFAGERIVNVITGEASLLYPRWKRTLKRCVTIPILGAQLLLLSGIIIGLYSAWTQIHASDMNRALKTLLVVFVSAIWGILVEFLNWHVFVRLAGSLNSWENYRTSTEFERQLVVKLFAFLFVDGFLWYFLLAFLHIPFGAQLLRLFAAFGGVDQSTDDFDQNFWELALVTSVETLLLICMPLATLWSVLPTTLRLLRAIRAPRPSAAAESGEPRGEPSRAEGETRDLETAPLIRVGGGLNSRIMSSTSMAAMDTEHSADSDSERSEKLLGKLPLLDRRRCSPLVRRHRAMMLAIRRTLKAMVEVDSLLDEARRPVYDPMLDVARSALEFGYVSSHRIPMLPICHTSRFLPFVTRDDRICSGVDVLCRVAARAARRLLGLLPRAARARLPTLRGLSASGRPPVQRSRQWQRLVRHLRLPRLRLCARQLRDDHARDSAARRVVQPPAAALRQAARRGRRRARAPRRKDGHLKFHLKRSGGIGALPCTREARGEGARIQALETGQLAPLPHTHTLTPPPTPLELQALGTVEHPPIPMHSHTPPRAHIQAPHDLSPSSPNPLPTPCPHPVRTLPTPCPPPTRLLIPTLTPTLTPPTHPLTPPAHPYPTQVHGDLGGAWSAPLTEGQQGAVGGVAMGGTSPPPAHEPHVHSLYPTSGPTSGGTLVSIRGVSLGRAVHRGEINPTSPTRPS